MHLAKVSFIESLSLTDLFVFLNITRMVLEVLRKSRLNPDNTRWASFSTTASLRVSGSHEFSLSNVCVEGILSYAGP